MKSQEFRLHLEELERRDTPSMLTEPAAAPSGWSQITNTATLTVMAHEGQAAAAHGLGAAARALMPQDRGAFRDLVIQAWKDPGLRDEMGAAARQELPGNPTGYIGAIDALLHPSPDGGVPLPTNADPTDPNPPDA